ncbi:MAG: nucleoside-diphosphate kinase [DPANN group archaeon]|nr:nucleoside-diphosphate kinase [DPANN group archaeon]
MIQRSLVLIKPDGVQRGLIGEILRRFEHAGLKMVGMKMVWMDKELSRKHYAAHVDKPFYPNVETYITSGPVVALVLEGVDAVENIRKLVGSTEPKQSPPGTIRGDFAHMSYGYADAHDLSVKNLIHASGTPDEAKKEVALWFEDDEIHSYKSVHDVHLL